MGDSILVLGIGNMLWADEGFGVRAVAALHDGWSFPAHVTLLDGGTQGLYLLPYVGQATRILVLDAIDYGLAPGTLRVLRDAEIPARLSTGKMSPHQTSFQEIVALASLSGWSPHAIALVGVQPLELRDFGGSLTPVVRSRLPEALETALAILAEWGAPGTPRTERAEPLVDRALHASWEAA
jgi:hydrogenase maturation protease